MSEQERHDDPEELAMRQRANQPPDPDDPIVIELRKAEARRRQITIAMGLVVLIAALVGVWALVTYRATFFRPPLPIQETEARILEETNDPSCRQMIAEVTATGQSFYGEEANIEAGLLAETVERSSTALETVTSLRIRIEQARSRSQEAVLRFDESRAQLDRWFEYTLNELALLERLGTEHRDALEPSPAPEDPQASDEPVNVNPPPPSSKAAPTRPPGELRDRALLAVHDAFQNFRVWHTSGLHPCGQAPEGTEGWVP
jgi:hypothetical protein